MSPASGAPLPTSPRQGRTGSPQTRPSTGHRQPPVLGRPRWSGSTAAALIHATTTLCLAVVVLRQAGPTAWEGWALLAPAVVILAGTGRPWTRWPLLVQAAVLAGVAVVTVTDTVSLNGLTLTAQAASALAVCQAGLAGLALHTAGALGRRGA